MILTNSQRRGLHGKAVILDYIKRTGHTIAGLPIWTRAELDFLRNLYPDRNALSCALPRRTRVAIASKAREIGLVPPLRIWSNEEATQLRRVYRTGISVDALVEMFPGRSRRQIWSKASHMRCRRPRRAPKQTGMLLVDSVRQRAFESRLSMRDLDAFVGKKHYFVGPGYIDWRALQRAIRILGGRPVVCWRNG